MNKKTSVKDPCFCDMERGGGAFFCANAGKAERKKTVVI